MKSIAALLAFASAVLAHGPCATSDAGKYGCDSANVLWECNGTEWVVLNDCGSVGYTCNAVSGSASTIGCVAKPANEQACADNLFGTYQCVGSSFQQCAYDPFWVQLENCDSTAKCVVDVSGFSGCLPYALSGTVAAVQQAADVAAGASANGATAGSAAQTVATSSLSEGAVAGVSVAGIAIVAIAAAFVVKAKAAKKSVTTETLSPAAGLLAA